MPGRFKTWWRALLFNIVLQKVIRGSKIETTGCIFHKSLEVPAFVNSIVVIGRSKRHSEKVLVAHQMRLKINKQTTKYMKPSTRNPSNIENIEYIEDFIYLGSLLNPEKIVGCWQNKKEGMMKLMLQLLWRYIFSALELVSNSAIFYHFTPVDLPQETCIL